MGLISPNPEPRQFTSQVPWVRQGPWPGSGGLGRSDEVSPLLKKTVYRSPSRVVICSGIWCLYFLSLPGTVSTCFWAFLPVLTLMSASSICSLPHCSPDSPQLPNMCGSLPPAVTLPSSRSSHICCFCSFSVLVVGVEVKAEKEFLFCLPWVTTQGLVSHPPPQRFILKRFR